MPRLLSLVLALACAAPAALAQQGATIPNAIGVWNSNGVPINGWYVVSGSAAVTVDAFQALPPELTTYFGSQQTGGKRELTFRGFEMRLTYGYTPPVPSYDSPNVQIRDAIVNPNIPNRWIPGPTTFADFASIAGLIPGSLPGFVTIVLGGDLGPGGGVKIPAGNPAGGALTMVWKNFPAFPTAGMRPLGTANEPAAGSANATTSYSGFLFSTGLVVVLPNPGFSSEFCWSWLFENSVIQPVRNATLVSSSGWILGGVPNPAPLAMQMDDGRGGINPNAGDAISYSGNSKEGNPAPGALGTTWFVPFVLHSGYLATGTNPPTEPWSTGAFAADNTPLRKWADDFCGITTLCPSPGTGAVLNPADSTYGMWMGVNLPNYLNMTALVENLGFADISGGPSWAGPATLAYHSSTNPNGPFGRNLIALAGAALPQYTATGVPLLATVENKSLLYPQAGYTPTVVLPGGMLGFGLLPAALAGTTLGIQCWMLDTLTSTIVDVTNVAVVRL